jgi:phage terminase large subunit-like protein
MRWACNNSKTETVGINTIIGKIEPKSRKTDSFKAFVAAECVSDVLDTKTLPEVSNTVDKVWIF